MLDNGKRINWFYLPQENVDRKYLLLREKRCDRNTPTDCKKINTTTEAQYKS
eukprot:m.247782 g.247782  ORF g.247782 m.247782 type:complete len:52 (+) comp33857_c6_seq22:4214-4369(+)